MPVLAVEQLDGRVVIFQVKLVPERRGPHLGHLVVARDLPHDLDEPARERAAARPPHAHILVVLSASAALDIVVLSYYTQSRER